MTLRAHPERKWSPRIPIDRAAAHRLVNRMCPQAPSQHVPRYLRACGDFIDEWARHGYGQLDAPAAVLAALQRVLAGSERFPRELFVAARRFQRVRP